MSAFDNGHGSGAHNDVDLEEMLQHMFNMRMPTGYGHSGSTKPSKGPDEEHPYHVTLEDLYKGKTAKFSSKKSVICSHCNGTGGKERAKPRECASCQGEGIFLFLYKIWKKHAHHGLRDETGSKICRPWLSHS